MPVCEICGEVVDRVYTCADCGIKFCKDCGDPDPKKKLCTLCSAYKAPRNSHRKRACVRDEDWVTGPVHNLKDESP